MNAIIRFEGAKSLLAILAMVSLVMSAMPVHLFAAPQGAGAVWTNTGPCGSPQNVNQYEVGEDFFGHGENFATSTQYSWVVKEPGANGATIESGTITTDSNGDFCEKLFTLDSSHIGGPYQFNVGDAKNDNFKVVEGAPEQGVLTVIKSIVNSTSTTPDDFSFQINGDSAVSFEADGENELTLDVDTYSVVEVEADGSGYTTTYDNCTGVVLTTSGATCTITNTYDTIPDPVRGCTDPTATNYEPLATEDDGSCVFPTVTGVLEVVKKIEGNSNAVPDNFSFTIDGAATTTFDSSTGVNSFELALDTYAVAEVESDAWTTTYDNCAAAVVTENATTTCTITNTWIPTCSDGIQNQDETDVDTGGICDTTGPSLCTVEIVSDTSAYVVEKDANAKLLSFVHPAWTAVITGASWIWGDDPVADPANEEVQTFVNKFGFEGTVTSATLEIASDNDHSATVNTGTANSFGNSFNNAQSYDVTTDIAQGNNELLVQVTNSAGSSNPASNPAGVLYKLTIEGEVTTDDDCAIPYEEVVETCEDGIQNQDETGVDTGGVCGNGGGGNGPDPVCSIGDNLLLNGSFEEPAIGGAWSLTTVTDWVVTKVSDSSSTLGELWRGLGVGPSEGEQNVELAAAEATQLAQSVTTVPGATYELSFDFAARDTNANNNAVEALVDGNTIVSTSTTETDWETYSQTFVASGTSTEIAIRDADVSDNSTGSLLDNAVLCYVSDPEEPEADLYRIFGYVWHDDNENTIWDGFEDEQIDEDMEDILAGWTVSITNGELTYSTSTDANGYYYFDVPEGTWTVTETVESGWKRTTQESFVVTVPEVFAQADTNFFTILREFVIPTAHAQSAPSIETYGPYNFGNDRVSGGGGRGGGSSSSSGTRVNRSTPTPAPLVLGEQVSAVPTGAPDTGKGGASTTGTIFGQLYFTPARAKLGLY